MYCSITKFMVLLVLLFLFSFAMATYAQDNTKITVEWIYSDASGERYPDTFGLKTILPFYLTFEYPKKSEFLRNLIHTPGKNPLL